MGENKGECQERPPCGMTLRQKSDGGGQGRAHEVRTQQVRRPEPGKGLRSCGMERTPVWLKPGRETKRPPDFLLDVPQVPPTQHTPN